MTPQKKRWMSRMAIFGGLLAVYGALYIYAYKAEIENAYRTMVVRPWHQHLERKIELAIMRYCEQMPPVDEIRMLRLNDKPGAGNSGTFDVGYHKEDLMYVVQTTTLTGSAAKQLAAHWRSMKLSPGSSAACFDPHHVIQFRSNGSIISEVVICFMCRNAMFALPPGKSMVSFIPVGSEERRTYDSFKSSVESLVGSYQR